MDIYKLKFTQLQMELFRLLCVKSGEALNQRQLAQLLDVSPTAIAKVLPRLEKEHMVIRERQKDLNLILVKLNRDDQHVLQLKRTENLKMLYESGLINFLDDQLPGATIVLFGSYARGDDLRSSDIDLAIMGRKEKELALSKFEKLLDRKILLNFYSSLKEIHKELRENICNGIVVTGGIEL